MITIIITSSFKGTLHFASLQPWPNPETSRLPKVAHINSFFIPPNLESLFKPSYHNLLSHQLGLPLHILTLFGTHFLTHAAYNLPFVLLVSGIGTEMLNLPYPCQGWHDIY